MPQFTKLFEPGKIGTIEMKNRIIMPPCGTHYSSLDGFVTDRQVTYYGERAKGGVGLIVTEGAGCRKRGKFGSFLTAATTASTTNDCGIKRVSSLTEKLQQVKVTLKWVVGQFEIRARPLAFCRVDISSRIGRRKSIRRF